jgi:DNA helicase HerA-like ATPase
MTGPAAFPLTHTLHASVSGTTGSGKSYLARVIVEEAAQYKSLSVLVLDPRNQSIGLLIPEDRPKVLQQYEAFGMKPGRARGFGFNYFAPGLPYASPLPADMSALSRGHAIVSFKGLNDEQRCATASKVLHSVFEACNAQECESPRLLVLIDEAQLFTRKRVDESAKQAAAGSERAIDRIAREGRKFGLCLVLVSQTMKDFGYELAAIRQMTTTKIFLRNSDLEIEYAGDIIGDGRQLVQLPTGTALIHNAHWGLARIRVRPPYSGSLSSVADVRRLIGTSREQSRTTSNEAQRVFNLTGIRTHAGTASPIVVGKPAGISSSADC